MSIRPELVTSVSAKDTSTMRVSIRPELVVETFTHEGRTMTITPPLRMPVEVTMDDGELWFNVSSDEFYIHTGAATLAELSENVAEALFVHWDFIAQTSAHELAEWLRPVKAAYLARVKVTP